ncbi:EamA family transporter [Planomonospora venezuelensis]|uniref:Drug/metabolite transporter (DMT)-like permease n=1 Tax=Planomonospora venezuelensis TaxID=1999 RepID=A0A841CRF6_PLAVE|nr:EamA family transporter [Planomonospora venezuelensis]MBB5961022.1 drug/metabolite transporter (DMT)-like permease [Planomonospora venezuelensis]GIN03489.1 drug/metabolite exporter YedA [Planomonospora venezuelensis]
MSPDTADRRTSLLVWGALSIVYVVWGSTYLGIMITIETIPPLSSGAMRFSVAALLLAAAVLLIRGRAAFRMTWREFCGAALVGLLLLTAGNGMVAVAEQHISSGLAALLVASVPLWLVVFRIVTRDRPRVLTLTGVLVGFGGVAALSLSGGSGAGTTAGIVTILLASLSWSVGSFLSSRIPMPADPFAASAVEMVAGAAGLAATATVIGERLDLAAVSGRSWAALVYLVLIGSLVGFTSYVWLLGNAPISLVSTYAYVNPVVAVVLGALILSEPVTGSMVAAGLVIVVGVALVVSTERRRRAVPEEEREPAVAEAAGSA